MACDEKGKRVVMTSMDFARWMDILRDAKPTMTPEIERGCRAEIDAVFFFNLSHARVPQQRPYVFKADDFVPTGRAVPLRGRRRTRNSGGRDK